MRKGGYIYILTNKHKTTLYIGVTSELPSRILKHKIHYYGPGSFSAKYNLGFLVYYEGFDTILEAIKREKQLKKWSRNKKVALIECLNPYWNDLSEEVKDF
jgi:putative endonuclease